MEHWTDARMLEMAAAFYWELYMARPEDPGAMQDCLQRLTRVLREDEGQRLVEEWTLEEVNMTLCSFQNSKTLGADGLPKLFNVAFWDQVGPDLQKIYREHLQEGHLGAGLEEGLITLLYKKGERQDLRN
ncbi:hypothetical protein Y1Q_0010067 [Alligator mississippiensis]|uniref:Reverse transcriptase domain-containing protein n=1 Tax=Alligator mississippiensis TaxID=8496 RepID=A0A151PFR0_ALLMI|nr:hypothetical protein Y1Q_0010067 [Alligator mississippiensis]